MRPYVKPAQEDKEVAELRRECPFASYIVSDNLIRVMIRHSNPARVRMAFRETRKARNAALQSWSPTLCRAMVLRIWKQLSSPTST